MNEADYQALLRKPAVARRNPVASGENANPVVECPVIYDAVAAPQIETKDTGRFFVHVTSYRTRLLDEDNLACKFHIDACRYAGLIPSDAPDQTTIKVSQIKVGTKAECRTEITIAVI